jgi:hypothetical protein
VRLKSQQQSATGEGAARGGERCPHLDRVMTVVIDQREGAATRQADLAVTLEAAIDTR